MATALVMESSSAQSPAPSSPAPTHNNGFASLQQEISYYKSQYEQLEVELQEFQASSRELEAELEKDVEASEKRERRLKEKAESLQYEVDEWKAKYKQSKAEANTAQNNLQKEITSLRDTNRTLTLKLRDIEVANDDYERQARNTTSSLEDLESKYNVALERGVMLEEEIKVGEQEREGLRIETQRLRDELSDLKVEVEITQEKLRAADSLNNRRRLMRISQYSDPKSSHAQGQRSPMSDRSTATTVSTPPAPPSEAGSTTLMSDALTPPSPPLSESSAPAAAKNDGLPGRHPVKRPSVARFGGGDDPNVTPRPSAYGASRSGHTRGGSVNGMTPSFSSRRAPRPTGVSGEGVPRSGSLYQIRGLIGKMQKLEERVHSVKSKLPGPTNTPPRASPRAATTGNTTPTPAASSTASSVAGIPSTVTVRSSKRRGDIANMGTYTPAAANGAVGEDETTTRRLVHRQSRVSVGASGTSMREESAAATAINRGSSSRPNSRANNSAAAGASASQHAVANGSEFARPSSRTSIAAGSNGNSNGNSNRPNSTLDQYRPGSAAEARRPRSSLGGATSTFSSSTASYSHGQTSPRKQPRHSQSHAIITPFTPAAGIFDEQPVIGISASTVRTPRRTTLDKSGFGSSIPAPAGTLKRQASSIAATTAANRRSLGYTTSTPVGHRHGGHDSGSGGGGGSGGGSGNARGGGGGDVGETY